MIEQELVIINKLGLHARASARLVEVASRFSSEIRLEVNNKIASAKSIMSVMMLAAHTGSIIKVIANGEDETLAISKISELINDRFNENE